MRIFCLLIVIVLLAGCAKPTDREYNPWITLFRISTGDVR